MRQLSNIRQRGLTLIEVMVAFAIASMLALAATPFFTDYGINSRLRESGNLVYGEALFAQSEAIKRNRPIRLSTSGGTTTVADVFDSTNPITLRTRDLPEGVIAATSSVSFASTGWPTPLTAVSIDLSHATTTCDNDHRCPGLRVDAGGAIRLCGNKTSC
jgi:type IV fimbrial biogenesis protein FimT